MLWFLMRCIVVFPVFQIYMTAFAGEIIFRTVREQIEHFMLGEFPVLCDYSTQC